jgi:hypothetical protein
MYWRAFLFSKRGYAAQVGCGLQIRSSPDRKEQHVFADVSLHPKFLARPNLKQEVKVSTRTNIAALVALTLATPALADCNQELKALEQNVVSAGTGASVNESGMPATKHQEEALAKQKTRDPDATGSTAGAVQPVSPHQEQVTGKHSTPGAENANQLMADARKLAAVGDEQGCMKKAAELKDVLGVK